MIELEARSFQEDLNKIKVWLSHAEQEIPFAMALTLTKMGQAGKAGATKSLPRIFKNPTPWTMKSIFLTAAKKNNLAAVVYIKDGSVSSLIHHIEGGKRPAKRYEKNLRRAGILKGSNQYAIPAGRTLNKYGNMTMARINKIMSAVGAQADVGTTSNTTENSLKRNKSQANYFLVRRSANTPSGIYETKGSGANQRLLPVMIFVKRTQYKRRFPFHEIVEDSGYDAIDNAIDEALKYIFSK